MAQTVVVAQSKISSNSSRSSDGHAKAVPGKRAGSALAFLLIDAVRTYGLRREVREVELSWIPEDNMPIRNMLAAIGGALYKRYRIYEKALT